MSNSIPSDLDSFLPLLSTTDTKMKLSIANKLLTYVTDPMNTIICSDIGLFIDTLVSWLQSSNYKIVQTDIEILTELVCRMQSDFQPYLSTLLPHLIDKLGDSKELIRETALVLMKKMIEYDVITAQALFDRIAAGAFTHKNSNVREQILYLLTNVLEEFGSSCLSVSKLMPFIVKLLSDPNAAVRSTAFDTLCTLYKYVGERLRNDLQKRYAIPHNKLPALMAKFDEQRASRDVPEDETDLSCAEPCVKKLTKVIERPPAPPQPVVSNSKPKGAQSMRKPASGSSQVGAVDDNSFLSSFEDVPHIQIYGGRDVEELMKKYHTTIDNTNEDWSKRADCLKRIRSLVNAGATEYDEFYQNLNLLLPSFHQSLKDLRSQVVREACITVAHFSYVLGNKFDHFAESVMPNLINLIQNSAKVMASSGLVCIRFILKHTHAPRLIPIIGNGLNSKSKDIRRASCEFLNIILSTWLPHLLEKQMNILLESIKKGIADADAEARAQSRLAFFSLSNHFPDSAEHLRNSLDSMYRKHLSGSNGTLAKPTPDVRRTPARTYVCATNTASAGRSNSAIDLQAAKRAKTRAQYAAMARQKFGGSVHVKPAASDRASRTRGRVSISQPTSRSGSPSSRVGYTSYLTRSRRSSTGADSSRETSPSRINSVGNSYKGRPPTQPTRKPLASARMLQQSREAETALADALGTYECTGHATASPRRNLYRTIDDQSDESETSSICSEHSFDAHRRPSDGYSWNGSQHRLHRDNWDGNTSRTRDIAEIIALCENARWNERKEGLISLQSYIQEGYKLELSDLKRIMDIFTKIFNDPHIKVFSMFLDTLNELITSHHEDLCFCLHILLTRLFNKLGTDLLNSVHSKILKTLDNVFVSFPPEAQLTSVFRFLVDPTLTPNNRVKLAALSYIVRLCSVVEPSAAFVSPSNVDYGKDYGGMALEKIIGWTMADNVKMGHEQKKVAQDAILALFNLNTSQVTRRLSNMPRDYQEAAAAICRERCSTLSSPSAVDDQPKSLGSLDSNSHSAKSRRSNSSPFSANNNGVSMDEHLSPTGNGDSHNGTFSTHELYHSFRQTTAEMQKYNDNINAIDFEKGPRRRLDIDCLSLESGMSQMSLTNSTKSQNGNQDALHHYLDELNKQSTEQAKKETLVAIVAALQVCSTEDIVNNFKLLLHKIVTLISESEPPVIKELALQLLQVTVRRKKIIHLLTQFSDLIITRVIAVCGANASGDRGKEVAKAAENCAVMLSTNLPAESVIRVIVPLITADAPAVKLVAIKMLTKLVECSDDDTVTLQSIDQIMPILLLAYDDAESAVRKAAVFCMVSLHRQSDEMKAAIAPYIEKLQGAKLKLLQLYIRRAEQGSSMPTSPKNP